MNKVYLGILGLIAVLLCSCNKQSSYEPKVITISASIDEDTKSTYTDAGVFSWVNGDEISYILRRDSDDIYNNNTLATNQSGTSVTFTGSTSASGYTAVNLAFYPKIRELGTYVNNDAKYVKNTLLLVNNSTTLKATLQQPIAAYPDRAKGIIPMIGKKTGEDANNEVEKYHFYPVTGVLKVSFTGLPATATQIRLDMPDNATYALNGDFNIDTSRETPEIKESDCVGTKWGQKYLNFDYASSDDAFYFPIPTGTIPAGKLTVSVSDGTNILYAVTNKLDIVLNRGEITPLPTIDVPSVKVKISGTPTAPKAKFYFSGDVAYVKYGNTMTLDYGPSINIATSGTEISLNHGFNYKFPLQYQAYNSSDVAIGSLQVLYYYALTETGISEVCKQFTSANSDIGLSGSRVPELTNNAPFSATVPTITFAASDNTLKGNIMVTEFCGVEGKVYGTYVDYQTASGTPSQNPPQIYIDNSVFCNVGGKNYILKENNYSCARFAVKTTKYGTPEVYGVNADLVCWGEYVGLYADSWGPYVHWFFDKE